MSTAEECHFEINFDELTGALTVTNNTGQSLKQTCHLWVKATVGHAYGTRDIWYSIEYRDGSYKGRPLFYKRKGRAVARPIH